jgi:short-subunit dehydrogenase
MSKKPFMEAYGPWALITGAAMGLGAEFASQLAERGLNLALVDLDSEALLRTVQALQEKYPVEVRPIVQDLAESDFRENIVAATEGLDIGLLVSNAGISALGEFLEIPREKHLRELAVNTVAPMTLAYEFGRRMVERGRGGIILLSSLSAMQGTALVANYAATKAYNLTLGESLWDELRAKGVDVLAFPPGSTDTPGFRADRPRLTPLVPLMTARETVSAALDALGKKPFVVPGWRNRVSFFITSRLLPRKAAIRLVGEQMRKIYRPFPPSSSGKTNAA